MFLIHITTLLSEMYCIYIIALGVIIVCTSLRVILAPTLKLSKSAIVRPVHVLTSPFSYILSI
ncbi:Uncharacterised protein [Paenibacillus polymyxa]|uniref:Uncharacterized protein n=1 Tax=Paenibacillus polymyxa TaxID=1406 RepID=A0A378XZ91_PAEPO|nr:Uncharacterised protein [Paenibacillus polymyxa]